jgi:phosphoglucomutase
MDMETVATSAYSDQKTGTSGLRKKVATFRQTHYLENFVQAIFDCLEDRQGATLVLGGDGRFHNDTAIQVVIAMAAANGFGRVLVGENGILSTPPPPVSSAPKRRWAGSSCRPATIRAGADGDFGIKYNVANGSPAPETLTDAIYARTCNIDRFRILRIGPVDLARRGTSQVGDMAVEVIDPVADYAALMESLFDFDRIGDLLRSRRLPDALRCDARRHRAVCPRHPGAPPRRPRRDGGERRAAAGLRRRPSRPQPGQRARPCRGDVPTTPPISPPRPTATATAT